MAVTTAGVNLHAWRRWAGRPKLAGVAYLTIGAIVALYVVSPNLTIVMAELLAVAGVLLLLRPDPRRDLRAWLVSLGVQFNQSLGTALWRPALADLLLLPLAFG